MLETPKIEGKFSLRASETGSIFLADARVGPDAILAKAKGLGAPFSCLNSARFGIAWGALGAAEACYDVARRYVGSPWFWFDALSVAPLAGSLSHGGADQRRWRRRRRRRRRRQP